MRPRVLSAPPLLYSSSVSLSHPETPFHLSRWADLQTATGCQPDVTLFTKLSLTIGWWGWLVTAFNPGLTMGLDSWLHGPARSPCGKWPLSPNPPWFTEHAQTSLPGHQRRGTISAGFCHCGKRGGAVIAQRQGLIRGKDVEMGISNEGPALTVLAHKSNCPLVQTYHPVAVAQLPAHTHQVPTHLSPAWPHTIHGTHSPHPTSFSAPDTHPHSLPKHVASGNLGNAAAVAQCATGAGESGGALGRGKLEIWGGGFYLFFRPLFVFCFFGGGSRINQTATRSCALLGAVAQTWSMAPWAIEQVCTPSLSRGTGLEFPTAPFATPP